MQPVCRVGDIGVGVCLGHKNPTPFVTVFTTGSSVATEEGQGLATVTTVGVATCGHTTVAVTGSPLTTADGMPVHRVGDIGVSSGGGTYVAATGSPTILSD